MIPKNENKTLLILDIDETLIFGSKEKLEKPFDFTFFNYFIYQRPYLKEFFDKIKDHFLIALWSSADDDYVEEIAKKIIPKDIKLEFVWARSRCSYKGNFNAVFDDYQNSYDSDNLHYHFVKPLKKLKKKGYKLERILIVDDTPHKSKENYGNAIYPKEFCPQEGEENDNELLLLADYLLTLKDKINVRKIEKRGWKTPIVNK